MANPVVPELDVLIASIDYLAELFQKGTEIRKMMVKFVNSMTMPGSGVKNLKRCKNWSDRAWESFEKITGKSREQYLAELKQTIQAANERCQAPTAEAQTVG